MGILSNIVKTWKSYSTEKKIGVIVDIVCGIGSGLLSTQVSKKAGEGHRLPARICIGTVVTGATLYAADKASEELMKEYGTPLSKTIDAIKSRQAKHNEQEEKKDE